LSHKPKFWMLTIETLLLRAERIYITNLSIVEMASALSKKVRTSDLAKVALKIGVKITTI
jgi:hypothetical protein